MENQNPPSTRDQTLANLESRIDELVKITTDIAAENQSLKTEQKLLRQEFQALQQKNKIAHDRLTQSVDRLKSLDG